MIEARGLTLHAAGHCLVRDLRWQAKVGERWCVIGRNAVGKSSLLRALAGLSVPQRSGAVLWLDREQHRWPALDAASVRAFAAQHHSDRFPISVRRLLELSIVVPGVRAIDATLSGLDADPLAERDVLQLSGGERQRVALAQCALQGAPLMLMDEPVAFQDPAHQLQVARWLSALNDVSLVVTAHDVNWIARTATHVLALYGEDGAWEAGPVDAMLQAARLKRAYGCEWRAIDGVWVAA
ncbi:MAG TPA: ABC transporter ATP-binding protein [Burkholderiaceae bacterium]|jgi:iron complex transport system ATP-binding protein|nr:ABC transporter ATP-binding protein [Burkholderiaceae bacterium]